MEAEDRSPKGSHRYYHSWRWVLAVSYSSRRWSYFPPAGEKADFLDSMVVVMTMNVGYFMSVLGGIFLGSLLVGRYAAPYR